MNSRNNNISILKQIEWHFMLPEIIQRCLQHGI